MKGVLTGVCHSGGSGIRNHALLIEQQREGREEKSQMSIIEQ